MILLHGDYTELFLMLGVIGLGGLIILGVLNYFAFRFYSRREVEEFSTSRQLICAVAIVANVTALVGLLVILS